jgi:hypothetical protein
MLTIKLFRIAVYGTLSMSSAIVIGNMFDLCSKVKHCWGRGGFIVACGIVSLAIFVGLLVLSLLGLRFERTLNKLELPACTFLFAWWIPGTALAMSSWTVSTPVIQAFSALCFLCSFVIVSAQLRSNLDQLSGFLRLIPMPIWAISFSVCCLQEPTIATRKLTLPSNSTPPLALPRSLCIYIYLCLHHFLPVSVSLWDQSDRRFHGKTLCKLSLLDCMRRDTTESSSYEEPAGGDIRPPEEDPAQSPPAADSDEPAAVTLETSVQTDEAPVIAV